MKKGRLTRLEWLYLSVAAVVFVLAALFFLLFGPLRYYGGMSPSDAKQLLDREIPPGTSRQRVITYIEAKTGDHFESKDGQRVGGTFPDTCNIPLLECSLNITFEFDSKGILVSTSVVEGYTGL